MRRRTTSVDSVWKIDSTIERPLNKTVLWTYMSYFYLLFAVSGFSRDSRLLVLFVYREAKIRPWWFIQAMNYSRQADQVTWPHECRHHASLELRVDDYRTFIPRKYCKKFFATVDCCFTVRVRHTAVQRWIILEQR